jgi:hypothetical protein
MTILTRNEYESQKGIDQWYLQDNKDVNNKARNETIEINTWDGTSRMLRCHPDHKPQINVQRARP